MLCYSHNAESSVFVYMRILQVKPMIASFGFYNNLYLKHESTALLIVNNLHMTLNMHGYALNATNYDPRDPQYTLRSLILQ